MKTIKHQLEDMKLQGHQTAMENYDHIELTPEQTKKITETALREARKKIHFENEERKYWDKVNTPVEYPRFDFEKTLKYFEKRVLELDPDFKINQYNQKIIESLARYFSADASAAQSDLNLKKGIMLVGPVGCGKTTIMKAFSINSQNPFAFVSSRRVASEYTDKKDGGDYVIKKYSSPCSVYPQQNFGFDKIGYCFDDIGVEQTQKHFGNERDVIPEIIYSRYDARLHHQTHFTANLTADDIEKTYGSRIRSRLREMCNFVEFDYNTPDFRK